MGICGPWDRSVLDALIASIEQLGSPAGDGSEGITAVSIGTLREHWGQWPDADFQRLLRDCQSAGYLRRMASGKPSTEEVRVRDDVRRKIAVDEQRLKALEEEDEYNEEEEETYRLNAEEGIYPCVTLPAYMRAKGLETSHDLQRLEAEGDSTPSRAGYSSGAMPVLTSTFGSEPAGAPYRSIDAEGPLAPPPSAPASVVSEAMVKPSFVKISQRVDSSRSSAAGSVVSEPMVRPSAIRSSQRATAAPTAPSSVASAAPVAEGPKKKISELRKMFGA
eukprot:TRINITY_DN39361_c0_g1_i1.p1 TRINITY_DN39361_c0_g1~~TRINITY_DN39361_c0_g1_i1.p1  ORF type:complete len:277 (+),score=53.56 TRINITY_DN39361_c0_g1_i1:73-903(+)